MTPVLHDPWVKYPDPRFLKHPQDSSTDRFGGDVDVRFHEKDLPHGE